MTETKGWVAGYNMVGYLPEMEPFATDDWLSAVQFLLGEMNRYVDAMTDTEFKPVEVDETIEAIVDLNAETDTDITVTYVCGNTAYWVEPCHVVATEDGFEVVDA